ncbi:MAG TPA: CopG family antitoxin [Ignavibacteriaceae bacterium]|nr:CopG family antitoxin [Ignavibacteriaceae bacterium]
MKKTKKEEIIDYDYKETTAFINKNRPLDISDIGFELPADLPTKVISLRLPTELLNKVKAYAAQQDVSYTSVIKMILARAVKNN